jgi:hypothetical protein
VRIAPLWLGAVEDHHPLVVVVVVVTVAATRNKEYRRFNRSERRALVVVARESTAIMWERFYKGWKEARRLLTLYRSKNVSMDSVHDWNGIVNGNRGALNMIESRIPPAHDASSFNITISSFFNSERLNLEMYRVKVL